MRNPENVPAKPSRSPSLQSDEQRLCNEALISREFDNVSDEQWVAMCEKVALGSRQADPAVSPNENDD